MNELTSKIKHELLRLGTDVVGFGSLGELPDDVRKASPGEYLGLPVGISVAVAYPPEVICGIAELPTQEYRERYRDDFFDPVKCRKTARDRAKQGFGGEITICGKCIEVCPYTQRYIMKP
jgi:hypothetical protein